MFVLIVLYYLIVLANLVDLFVSINLNMTFSSHMKTLPNASITLNTFCSAHSVLFLCCMI